MPAERFGLKERVTFKTQDSKRFTGGILQNVSKESIEVDGVIYPLSEIVAFKTHGELLNLAGSSMAVGGVFFTGIIFVNRLINSDSPLLRQNQIYLGAGLVAGGLLVRWASRKTYNKEKGWEWVVIDFEEVAREN